MLRYARLSFHFPLDCFTASRPEKRLTVALIPSFDHSKAEMSTDEKGWCGLLPWRMLEVSSPFHAYPFMHTAVLPSSLLSMRSYTSWTPTIDHHASYLSPLHLLIENTTIDPSLNGSQFWDRRSPSVPKFQNQATCWQDWPTYSENEIAGRIRPLGEWRAGRIGLLGEQYRWQDWPTWITMLLAGWCCLQLPNFLRAQIKGRP